jgi:3-phenylpropionate/trans-cinnamate dioxygenase ferredoxin reductase component
MNADRIVVVGGGIAGAAAIAELRRHGHDGPLTLISSESHAPYERPPLSKQYVIDQDGYNSTIHPVSWYPDNRVDLILGRTATQLAITDKAIHHR